MSSVVHESRTKASGPRSHPRRLEFRCAGCGYGCVVAHSPGRCPMCGGSSWSPVRAVHGRRMRG